MTGPNFYTIDFTREIVLQGRTTTFLTVRRNDDDGGDPTKLQSSEDLWVVMYPHTRTFDSYATTFRLDSDLNFNLTNILDFPFTKKDFGSTLIGTDTNFSFNGNLSFNAIEEGMFVKDSHRYVENYTGPTSSIGPVTVTSARFVKSPPITVPVAYEISLTGTNFASEESTAFINDYGYWDKDASKRWAINGKSVDVLEKSAYESFAAGYTNFENPFDGTTEGILINGPESFMQGTGYISRSKAGWIKIPSPLATFGLTGNAGSFSIRIDYDGEQDSHMKLNLLIARGTNLSPYDIISLYEKNRGGIKGNPEGTTGSNYVDYQEVHLFGYTNTKNRVTRSTEQMSLPSQNEIFEDKVSYSLLKTNPKISGNVKITVDATEAIWLNSIDANNELADSSYKKYPISSISTYARDLYKFFKDGQTPPSVVFDLYQSDDLYQSAKRNLYEQYDNFYSYGVEQLKSKFYDEEFSFFAPLWLRKKIPEFFVIFRVEHPFSDVNYRDNYIERFLKLSEIQGSTVLDPSPEFLEFFKNARIIKTYDMRETSPIGSYLRKIVNDPRFRERPLEVSFEDDVPTVWNGVSYANGTMSGKSEFLSEYWRKDRPIIELEEYVTGGFERNGIISTNLINLEFLFDDTEAKEYSINRYFGLYVSENQLANFQLDPDILGKISGQTPTPKPGIDGEPYSTKEFIQTNENGIELPVHYYHNPTNGENTSNVPAFVGSVEGKFPLPEFVNDPLRIFYIKDRDDSFKRLIELNEVDYGNPGTSDYKRVTQLKLFDKQEDISKYAGVNQITSQFVAKLLDAGHSQLRLHLQKNDEEPVFSDEEEIEITFNQYNYDERNHAYYVRVSDVTPTSLSVDVFKDQYVEKLITSFFMPSVGSSVTILVADINQYQLGETVYITSAGYFEVSDIFTSSIGIKNVGNPVNAAVGAVISNSQLVSISGLTYQLTYTYNPFAPVVLHEFTIDSLLTLLIENSPSLYTVGDSYQVEIKDTEVYIDQINGTTPLFAKASKAFQQFRWRMIANSLGLPPKDAWDYPVEDISKYEYVSTFSNEGTAEDVAKALAQCINSFDNRPCDAYAIDETVYLRAKRGGVEGNQIEISRKLKDKVSNVHNLGFYENGNVNLNQTTKVIAGSPYEVFPTLGSRTSKAGTIYYHIKFEKQITGNWSTVRVDVDPTSLATARTTGLLKMTDTSGPGDIIDDPNVPFSINVKNVPLNTIVEYIIEINSLLDVRQLFVGGNDRKRNRARINFVDGQRYFSDRRTELFGSITLGSKQIKKLNVTNLYIGSLVSGDGIPKGTRITYIDYASNEVYITNKATKTLGNVKIIFGEFSIVNTKKIGDQWYQAQKGLYSVMEGWNIQGKYVYSLPYLEEPTYDRVNLINDFVNLGEYSIIELENKKHEFYQGKDKRIIACNIYRPPLGIFSVFPIKNFDFDLYFSEYAYSPILETFRYYFKEELKRGESIILPPGENYKIEVLDEKINVPLQFEDGALVIDIQGYNPNTKNWDYLDTIRAFQDASVPQNSIFINTYYPFYAYDEKEHPRIWSDDPNTAIVGVGHGNYVRKKISVYDPATGKVTETPPPYYRLVFRNDSLVEEISITKTDFGRDEDVKSFQGFSSISDMYTIEDAEEIKKLISEEKYIDAFLRQSLRSEYDRLRENYNKEYATRSVVVPYINKWVQAGTDARDNYYRLSTSRAFGITNFSPDYSVNFSEPSLLTNEFTYLDTVPKDYPVESLEGSRSYMFAKLNDIATGEKTWYELLTENDDKDWFTKYFSLGYPSEINPLGELIPKSRDERFTFFEYTPGTKRSQTLFRGGKIQIVDINNTILQPTEIIESTKYQDYKFSAITRILPHSFLKKESNFEIEICKNEKHKSIVMIITVRLQDYRVQSGLYDYLFLYAVNDQLKNYNQIQTSLKNGYQFSPNSFAFTPLLASSGSTNITPPYKNYIAENLYYSFFGSNRNDIDFYSYINKYPVSVNSPYEFWSYSRPRQMFFGAGVLELGDTKIGGIAIETRSNETIGESPDFNDVVDTVKFEFSDVSSISAVTISNLSGSGIGPAVYRNVSAVTNTSNDVSLGSGAKFDVTVDGDGTYSVKVVDGGKGYSVYDIITIPGTSLGGNVSNNLVLNVVNSSTNTYNYTVLNEIIPPLNRYKTAEDIYRYADPSVTPTNFPLTYPISMITDGSLFKLVNVGISAGSVFHINRIDRKESSDVYLPTSLKFSTIQQPEFSRINPGQTGFLFELGSNIITSSTGVDNDIETFNIKGGTSTYTYIKNLLTYASIKELVNNDDPKVKYYKIENNQKISLGYNPDYKIRFIAPDQIVKTGMLSYVNDEEKPDEYLSAKIIGYNIVNTDQNEIIFRHRGFYEPKTVDVLSFWVREDKDFSNHFEKDFLLGNTHFNANTSFAGLLRNLGINKVSDQEVLKIKTGSAYKSLYPLVGEVAVDRKDAFLLSSTWDKNFYRKYFDNVSFSELNGLSDMKEFKSYFGSKVMNVPKTQLLETFEENEITFNVLSPSVAVGSPILKFRSGQDTRITNRVITETLNRSTTLSSSEIDNLRSSLERNTADAEARVRNVQRFLNDVQTRKNPTLIIDIDIKSRLLRKLYEDMNNPEYQDEFLRILNLNIPSLGYLSEADLNELKKDYLSKNILELYAVSEIKLYALSKEGIPVFDPTLDDDEKTLAGYRVDKDCQVTNLDDFAVRITKQLDTKKPYGYAVTAVIKRI